MGDEALDILRRQALESLRLKKAALFMEEGELTPRMASPVPSPIVFGRLKQTPPQNPPKQQKKKRKKRPPTKHLHAEPQTRQQFTVNNDLYCQQQQGWSFHYPNLSYYLKKNQYPMDAFMDEELHVELPPHYVIDLDTSEDDGHTSPAQSSVSLEPGEIKSTPAPLVILTQPLVVPPTPLIIPTAPHVPIVVEDKNQDAKITDLKRQIEDLDESNRKNEKIIADAVFKQNELKEQLKHYKQLITKGKEKKLQLAKKKTDLLNQLAVVRTEIEIKLSSASSSAISIETVPITESFAQTSEATEATTIFNEAPKLKRKAEMEELEKQLEKVRLDLDQSKRKLLAAASKKKITKKRQKKEAAMKNKFAKILAKTKDVQGHVKVEEPFNLGDELILVDGHLFPSEPCKQLWSWIKSKSSDDTSRSNQASSEQPSVATFNEYESPLKWFKSSVFFKHFCDLVPKKGILSSTFQCKIDPMVSICRNEFEFGCQDTNCQFQHFNQIIPSNDVVLGEIIRRLMDYSSGDKNKVLTFIHERLSASGLEGVPLVTLVDRLLALKEELSTTDLSVLADHIEQASTGVSDKNFIKTQLKNFLVSIASLPGKHYFELTKDILRVEHSGTKRYYCDSEAEPSLIEEMFKQSEEGQLLPFLESLEARDEDIQLLRQDLLSGLNSPALYSGLDKMNLTPKLLWHAFMLLRSFDKRCWITSQILPMIIDPEELFDLVMGLEKTAIDAGLDAEAKAIFMAVLLKQMSLDAETLVPTAFLCSPPCELTDDLRVKLWVFFFDYLGTGGYQPGWFYHYPYDDVPSHDFCPLLSWVKPDIHEFCLTTLDLLLREQPEGLAKEVLLWNKYSLSIAKGIKPAEALSCLDSELKFVMHRFVSVPEGKVTPEDTNLSVLFQSQKLSKLGLQVMSHDLLLNYDVSGSACEAALLVSFMKKEPRLISDLQLNLGSFHDFGHSVLTGRPQRLSPVRMIPLQKHASHELERDPEAHRHWNASEDVETLTDRLLLNPSSQELWKKLIAYVEELKMPGYVDQLHAASSQFCQLH